MIVGATTRLNIKGRERKLIDDRQYRTARDSKPIEVLGTYNPIPQKPTGLIAESIKTKTPYKQIELDSLRTKYWLGVGAQPSEPAFKLLSMVRL
jgi:small subunit ribosomal protein S16